MQRSDSSSSFVLEFGGDMTAAEIYESMDACMAENKGKDFRIALPALRGYTTMFGQSVGRTADDILSLF